LKIQGEPSDEQQATIESLSSSMKATLLEANDFSEVKIPAALKPFEWRIRIMKGVADSSFDEVKNVIETVRRAVKNSGLQLNELMERGNKIIENMNA
jgi:uncharacterized protein YoxC